MQGTVFLDELRGTKTFELIELIMTPSLLTISVGYSTKPLSYYSKYATNINKIYDDSLPNAKFDILVRIKV